jgi:HPt (histidine-containing phosphotransfer) domain-containing protein
MERKRPGRFHVSNRVLLGAICLAVLLWLLDTLLAGLRGLQGGEETNIVGELADLFLGDARSGIEALEEAVNKGDAPTVREVSHMLKGSSGNMGARRMAELCAQLEEAGASGDLSRSSELVEQLAEEFGRVDRALRAEVGGSRG